MSMFRKKPVVIEAAQKTGPRTGGRCTRPDTIKAERTWDERLGK